MEASTSATFSHIRSHPTALKPQEDSYVEVKIAFKREVMQMDDAFLDYRESQESHLPSSFFAPPPITRTREVEQLVNDASLTQAKTGSTGSLDQEDFSSRSAAGTSSDRCRRTTRKQAKMSNFSASQHSGSSPKEELEGLLRQLKEKEVLLETKEIRLNTRERCLNGKQRSLDAKEKLLNAKESYLKVREECLNAQEDSLQDNIQQQQHMGTTAADQLELDDGQILPPLSLDSRDSRGLVATTSPAPQTTTPRPPRPGSSTRTPGTTPPSRSSPPQDYADSADFHAGNSSVSPSRGLRKPESARARRPPAPSAPLRSHIGSGESRDRELAAAPPPPSKRAKKTNSGCCTCSSDTLKSSAHFICVVDGCKKCFKRERNLKSHHQNVHLLPEEKQFGCDRPDCSGKKYPTRNHLKRHMDRNHGICQYCDHDLDVATIQHGSVRAMRKEHRSRCEPLLRLQQKRRDNADKMAKRKKKHQKSNVGCKSQ